MKVFVSSTTKDLGEARKKACEQLLQLHLQPVSMDSYTSGSKPPKQRDDAEVKDCAGFVLIVGYLYGSCPEDEDKSFTELEYEAAVESDMEVFPFLASDEFPVPPSLREDDATYQKLQAFRKRLEKDHTPRYFDNIDKLCAEVAAAIPMSPPETGYVTSQAELEFLYKNTLKALHPCVVPKDDDIDWSLVENYARAVGLRLGKKSARNHGLLSELELFSPILHQGQQALHKPAVLCFCQRPDKFETKIDTAASSVFLVGEPGDPEIIIENVYGPMSSHITRLLELTMDRLQTVARTGKDGRRVEEKEIPHDVIRELISNAIAHRDYDQAGQVQVCVIPDAVEVRNPGTFPTNTSWDLFLRTRQVSKPVNVAVCRYLKKQLLFEGIGQGFGWFRKHLERNGPGSIKCEELPGPTTLVRVSRRKEAETVAPYTVTPDIPFASSAKTSKLFVSSTTGDFGDARKRVCGQLLQLDIQPVSMDWYKANGKPPKQLDDARVKECDAFIIIVGHLYGSSPLGETKSFTELEYESAVVSGKPVYAFLASDKFLMPPYLQEDDATRQKLKAFRKRLTENHTTRYFDNIDQLCVEIVASIPKPKEKAGRISVPKIPQPYLAHPYPLQENFTGRLKERAMLTEWVCTADSRPMLSLVGMGGLGKSALTWYWLHEDVSQEKLKFSGIIWWSFYEGRASFESFLSHALLYASGGTIDPAQLPSDYDRMQSLWILLKESSFLIIFDGAERLLRAYHALDATYKGDDFGKEAGDNHLRCANPQTGQFLQWLASPGVKTRTLLTTRLHPKEVQRLPGCRKEDLEHLDPDDAVEFMRRQGVKGPRNAIVHACEPYDFLPLCIRLLSGAIREDPEWPGDIAAAENWHPPKDLVRREHHILQVAYDTMAKDRQNLLSRIAAMRGPVDYETAKVLSTYKDEDKLKEALRELVARGLLLRREGQAHYDLHRIVKQYAYDRLANKGSIHQILKDYFDTVPLSEKVESLEDLLPTIELFHHTIRSGAYEEAVEIYRNRLADTLYFQLGAYDVDISLKQAFFPDGENAPPHLKDESAQAWVLHGLAVVYTRTGQSRKALGLLEWANDMDERKGRKDNLAFGLVNLAEIRILLGELKGAESNLRRETEISRAIGEEWDKARGYRELGRLLSYLGQYDQADEELEMALGMFASQNDEQAQSVGWSYRGLRAILMNEPKLALKALQEARQFWKLHAKHKYPVERDLVDILWLLGTAKRLDANTASAEVDINEALSRCRRIRLVEFEADILLEMAKLQWQKTQSSTQDTGDRRQKSEKEEMIVQAKSLTREALDIADRCEYRLKQADIHNFLAEMAIAEGDKATALKHAEIAKERAWCDGPPYCYKKALDEAEQMLSKLA